MAQAANFINFFRDKITINMGASIGCQTQSISVMSSRNFHGPTPQLIFEHDCLVRGAPIPKKLISLNKIQKK